MMLKSVNTNKNPISVLAVRKLYQIILTYTSFNIDLDMKGPEIHSPFHGSNWINKDISMNVHWMGMMKNWILILHTDKCMIWLGDTVIKRNTLQSIQNYRFREKMHFHLTRQSISLCKYTYVTTSSTHQAVWWLHF